VMGRLASKAEGAPQVYGPVSRLSVEITRKRRRAAGSARVKAQAAETGEAGKMRSAPTPLDAVASGREHASGSRRPGSCCPLNASAPSGLPKRQKRKALTDGATPTGTHAHRATIRSCPASQRCLCPRQPVSYSLSKDRAMTAAMRRAMDGSQLAPERTQTSDDGRQSDCQPGCE
jgi:hypothetical protein